jgi:hypothetical protein
LTGILPPRTHAFRERKRRQPSRTACILLALIDRNPATVMRAVGTHAASRSRRQTDGISST